MSEPFDPHGDERTMSSLGRALPRVAAPPDDLFARIVAATESVSAPASIATPSFGGRRKVTAPLLAAALAAAAAVAITIGIQSRSGLGTPAASAPVAAHLASARVHGRAELFHPTAPNGVLRLHLQAVPAPPPGSHYEVWVLPRGSAEMTAVGAFTPAKRTITLSLPLPAAGTYAAVDISVQKNNGPAAHSSVSLAGASFSAGS
jgi:Anti-sigma-K factor rskA